MFDGNCRTLILGSFPSVKSREVNFYYGNRQNRFWKMLCKAFGKDFSQVVSTEDKIDLCLSHGVALWDIVSSCEIDGSADTDIKNYTLADLSLVLDAAPVGKILCNGAKAFQLTKSAFSGDILVKKMPSTSSANVRFDESVWLCELRNQPTTDCKGEQRG